MADEKKLDILSPEAKKWVEDQEKGRAELASEKSLYEERMANTRSNYEKFDRAMKVDLWNMVGNTTTEEEFMRLRQAIIDKYDALPEIDKHGGRIDQAPYRMFSWHDIRRPDSLRMPDSWEDELTGEKELYGADELKHQVKEYLAHLLNAKYFPGDQGPHPDRKHYERRRNVGLRTEGAPWPMEGEALERDRPGLYLGDDGRKEGAWPASDRQTAIRRGSDLADPRLKLDQGLMNKINELLATDPNFRHVVPPHTYAPDIMGKIEQKARRNIEHERYDGTSYFDVPLGKNTNRLNAGIEYMIR